MPFLVNFNGLTLLGQFAAGACVGVAVLVIVAAPYWLMSRVLGLPIRDDAPR
jgi:hypothetical protein